MKISTQPTGPAGTRTIKVRDSEWLRISQLILDGNYKNQADVVAAAVDTLQGQREPSSVIQAVVPGNHDTETKPETPNERRIVTAILAMMRKKNVCPVHLPVIEALLGLKPQPKDERKTEVA